MEKKIKTKSQDKIKVKELKIHKNLRGLEIEILKKFKE